MTHIIPASVKAILPKEGKEYYEQVYLNSYSRNKDELLAHQVAWKLTRSKMKEVNGQLVCNSEDFAQPKLYSFEADFQGEVLIRNSDNGELEMDIVLANTSPRKSDGNYFTEEELQIMAEQINSYGSTLPDVDHAVMQKLLAQYGNNKVAILNAVKKEKGIFKKIQALVREGKLWVRAIFDKRYKNHVQKYNKVSIEAFATPDNSGRLRNPTYVGFTFTPTPQLEGVGVAS